MGTDVLMITPHVYFKPKNGFNENNVKAYRNRYRTLSKIDLFDGHEIDERSLLDAAKELRIKTDSDGYKNLLRESVKYEDIDLTFVCVDLAIDGSMPEVPLDRPPATSTSQPTETCSKEDKTPTKLTEIVCVFLIKQRNKDIDNFLLSHILQIVKQTSTNEPTKDGCSSLCDNKPFLLHPGSLLALFIYEQMHSLGEVRQGQSSCLRLVQPLIITDEFGTWSYDHFRGLFEMQLYPYGNKSFPTCWVLVNDARIYCQFVFSGTQQANEISTSFTPDRPQTNSLEQFVREVCAKESMKADEWIRLLYEEYIFSFTHLSNLKQIEWDNIKRLPMNAKRILKTAIDRERERVDDDRRRRFEKSLPNEDISKSSNNSPKESRSELLANLHLIKLFIYYTLRFEQAIQCYGALSKLEAACIDASFAEMREEGYADDGLFSTMGEFFLPLTISEQEIKQTRTTITDEARQDQLENYMKNVESLKTSRANTTTRRWDTEKELVLLNQAMKEAYSAYMNNRLRVEAILDACKRTKGFLMTIIFRAPKQANELRRIDREWLSDREKIQTEICECETKLVQYISRVEDYDRQIDDLNTQINNLQTEFSQPQRPIDKGLVKPARGFIMYGPPGTGKSEIMSKLSTKLGVAMVGPPLAAGELNRPLVGESERVIIALASRCHRVPYAMCCLSIDEIDSLAPKRDEDSSEGKVDKISVLLSLIDGIKDVPNLMIFCATNRLHMMDEAFLRRMSGKFFVGRPSSQARIRILAQIPEWALEPDLIDRLAIASTNFSGAACKAFARAITVRCMTAQRTQSNYHVDYQEALMIADRTAQQYQIFLGSETLPRLLLRNLNNGSRIRMNHLLRHVYKGRMIVDLHDGSVRIEIFETNGRIAVIEHKLNPNETSVQSLLERLTGYGKDRNVQLLQLIDLNLLASQGAYDEKKVFETLKERYDECVAYARSMIIYDLDALVGVNKSESDSSMGRSMSSSVVNQSVYTYVRARFREAVVEQQDKISNGQQQTIEKWAVAVIREPFLLRQFMNDVQFARTRNEEEELELERRKAEDLLKCVKCKDLYIENENKMGNCVHHDGFIYDNAAADLAVYVPSAVAQFLTKVECDMINQPEKREEFERQKNKFKWICCDATVTVGSGAGGCKKGKHYSGEQTREGGRGRGRDGRRLDQVTINLWEDECRRNEEYNEKWLILLENRS